MVGGQAGTLWERGMPAFGATTGTFSGVKCWDINLNTGYQSNAKEALYSPYFDFTLTGLPALSFAMNINSEFMWDGLRMDYTIDSGLTWQVLGTANAPPTVATNWYTNVSLNSSQNPDGQALHLRDLFPALTTISHFSMEKWFASGLCLLRTPR